MQHLPWWSFFLVLCVFFPLALRFWVQQERKNAQERTRKLVRQIQRTKTHKE